MKSTIQRFLQGIFEGYAIDAYAKSGTRFIYRTSFGIDTYVHPQKIADLVKTNMACDAEPWIRSLSECLPVLDTVIDVGANIGIVTCWLAKRSRLVYSFEPEASNREFMKKNIALNNIENVNIQSVAVGNENGTADFSIRESFGHHGLHLKHVTRAVKTEKVPIVSLDAFCEQKGIKDVSLLKIDVEGSELDVLRGFSTYLSSGKVQLIVFEHAPVLHTSQEEKISVFDLLTSFGYSIFDIEHSPVDRRRMLVAEQGDFYAKTI